VINIFGSSNNEYEWSCSNSLTPVDIKTGLKPVLARYCFLVTTSQIGYQKKFKNLNFDSYQYQSQSNSLAYQFTQIMTIGHKIFKNLNF
jgi:hypothetical protein